MNYEKSPRGLFVPKPPDHAGCQKIRCALDLQVRCFHEHCTDFTRSEEGGILLDCCSSCYNREDDGRDGNATRQ